MASTHPYPTYTYNYSNEFRIPLLSQLRPVTGLLHHRTATAGTTTGTGHQPHPDRKRRPLHPRRVPQPGPVPLTGRSKIIDTYDGNGDGICETIEVAKWLVDCYRAMNRSFSPTATDIASYVQIVDKNKNGKVSRE